MPTNPTRDEAVAWAFQMELDELRNFEEFDCLLARNPDLGQSVPLYSAATVTALEAEVRDLRDEVGRLQEQRQAILGVGDGTGKLFVNGDYESIKECQRRLIAGEAAERLLAECLKFIDGIHDDLHNRRTADWFPAGAHDAATSMSEDMRLIGNACAEFDPYQDTGAGAK